MYSKTNSMPTFRSTVNPTHAPIEYPAHLFVGLYWVFLGGFPWSLHPPDMSISHDIASFHDSVSRHCVVPWPCQWPGRVIYLLQVKLYVLDIDNNVLQPMALLIWWLLLLLLAVAWYPWLRVYVAQIHVNVSARFLNGIEPTTKGIKVPYSDQLNHACTCVATLYWCCIIASRKIV